MFCSKCGAENDNNAMFCSSCGNQLKPSSSVIIQASDTIYAGFWRRFIAILIDTLILVLGGGFVIFVVVLWVGILLAGSVNNIDTISTVGTVVGSIVGIVLQWLYFTISESSKDQATLGKRAMGIIVTDLKGNKITFGKANGRYWGKIVSRIILYIGFIIAGFTEKKQALHDIIAETLVVVK